MKKNERGREKHRNMFLVLAVSPIVIMLIAGTVFFTIVSHGICEKYKLSAEEAQTPYVLFDKVLLLNAYTKDIYQELSQRSQKDVSQLLVSKQIHSFNHLLRERYSYLVVEKEGVYIYIGNPNVMQSELSKLPQNDYSFRSESAIYVSDKSNQILYKKIPFTGKTGERGNIYIITDATVVLPHIKDLTYGFLAVSFFIMIVITIAIVGYAYYHIISPIKNLQIAVKAIGQGDLDRHIDSKNKGEFTQLYVEFENMRIKLKESMSEQEKANALTREVIGNISHDLKTPLTAIQGYAEGILDGVAATPERRDKYLQTIRAKAKDMSLLVDELAFFTNINQNNVPYNYTKVNVNHYFSNCVSEHTLDLEMKNINVIFQTKVPKKVEIFIDVEKMKRVIANIIGNASKYIKNSQGVILVRLWDDEDSVVIRIEDNGQGISRAELPFIFERFYRTDSSRNSVTGGSGLGLAIAKKIIEDHGGRISAESIKGKGTAIILELAKKNETEVNP